GVFEQLAELETEVFGVIDGDGFDLEFVLEKFKQQHEGNALVAAGKGEELAVGRSDGIVVPFWFIDARAFGINEQLPAEMLGEELGEFVFVAGEETEGIVIVLRIEIGALQ